MVPQPLAFALGALSWTAAEYALHRFVGHGPKLRVPEGLAARLSPQGLLAGFNAEHLAHHANPQYFAPTAHKLAAAGVVITGLYALGRPLTSPATARAFALGFGVFFGGYELLHRRIHTHPPQTAYGRWRRQHHLQHHHRSPRDNHGVTHNLFDVLGGTAVALGRVKVPRRQAPGWMLTPDGELKPEYSAAYELVGTRPEAQG
ncbi:MAG: sterol desaturase family protein [Myxococcales bacterium]|nr:sterol desaturase family protein [Myxococcales bacterium]